MRCPNPRCKNKLLQKVGTRIRLRTKGVHTFHEDGHCTAQCYWCGEEVKVPVTLNADLQVPGENFFVRPPPGG